MHSQPARRSKVGGSLWRDDHQQPGQVHLQTHLRQGTSPSRPRLAPVIITSFPLFRQAIGAPRNTLSMATCTTVMGSKFVTCLAPGTRPSSAGRTLTPPNAYGELVSQIMLQK